VTICLLITDLNIGGAEKAMVNLALGLPRNRWRVHVINLGGEEPLAERLRTGGVTVHCLGISKRKPFQAIRKLTATLRQIRPHLLQCFMFHSNVAGRLAALQARVPWVLGGLRVAEHQKGWHLTFDRLTTRMSLGSVCVSEGVRQFSITYGGIAEDRLWVIPNGVDVRPFDVARPIDRKTLGFDPADRIALFVGRLDPQKGLPYLLEAVEQVAAKRPRWKLAMTGREGTESEWFRERVAESPILSQHVKWFGFRDDIPALLKTAEVLLLPSLWEGMPNVVLEAMAAGRAVIGTDVEGTHELVLPGKTGWLVPPENSEALAEAMADAFDHPDRTERFGKAGRERVEAHYTLAGTIKAYEWLWARVLGLDPNPH
jgi:starch synthase (maltosyl-transferring)